MTENTPLIFLMYKNDISKFAVNNTTTQNTNERKQE